MKPGNIWTLQRKRVDKLIVNGNYIPITEVGKQYQTGGGEGNGSD